MSCVLGAFPNSSCSCCDTDSNLRGGGGGGEGGRGGGGGRRGGGGRVSWVRCVKDDRKWRKGQGRGECVAQEVTHFLFSSVFFCRSPLSSLTSASSLQGRERGVECNLVACTQGLIMHTCKLILKDKAK